MTGKYIAKDQIAGRMVEDATDEDLIDDLKDFSNSIGKTPTSRELDEYGPHNTSTYQDEFGSWNDALIAAGLEPNHIYDISKDDILKDILRVSNAIDKSPTLSEMDNFGKYSKMTYKNKLDSYVDTLENLGLEPSAAQYNFSSNKKPDRVKYTKNVRKLKTDGPLPLDKLPGKEITSSDKRHGLARFEINSGKVSPSEPIYYLFDEHEPEHVAQRFLEVNPDISGSRSEKAIVSEAGNFGSSWSSAMRSALDK